MDSLSITGHFNTNKAWPYTGQNLYTNGLAAGDSTTYPCQKNSEEVLEEAAETAYVTFLFGGGEAQQEALEEENKQVRQMFEEYRDSSAAGSEVCTCRQMPNPWFPFSLSLYAACKLSHMQTNTEAAENC